MHTIDSKQAVYLIASFPYVRVDVVVTNFDIIC
jgi:hypothetical protein